MPSLFDPSLAGFGDLSAALLQGPEQARRNRIQEQELEMRRREHEDAINRALRLDDERQQDRADNKLYKKFEMDRLTKNDADAEQKRSYDSAKGLADQGRDTLKFYEEQRHNKAMEGNKVATAPSDNELVTPKNGSKPYLVSKRTGAVTQIPAQLTDAQIKAAQEKQNTAETGYPDREWNWYNPADWFRHPPAGAQPSQPSGYIQPQDPVASTNWFQRATATGLTAGDPVYHNIPTASSFNASQDASLAHPTHTPGGFAFPSLQPDGSDPHAEAAAFDALPAVRQAKYRAILATGDPKKIAAAKAILLGGL